MQAFLAISYIHGRNEISWAEQRSPRSADMKASWAMSSARAWSETMPRTYATMRGR